MTDPHLQVGAYALNALSGAERAEFQAHLTECPDCRREVEGFAETTAGLAVIAETAPPVRLRMDVLAAVSTAPQDEPDPAQDWPRPEPAPPAQLRDDVLVAVSTAPQDEPEPASDRPGPEPAPPARPRQRRTWRHGARLAVAAVLAIAMAFGGWAVGRHQLSQSVQAQSAAVDRLLRAPDARIYRHPMPDGTSVSYVVSQQRDAAMVLLSGRSDPGQERVYQLWTLQPHPGANDPVATPDRTFAGTEDSPVWIDGDVSSAAAVAITIEPEGGSPTPTSKPFAVQSL